MSLFQTRADWNVRVRPIPALRAGVHLVTSRPASSTRPLSGVTKPAMASTSVLLPLPFGPTSPTMPAQRQLE